MKTEYLLDAQNIDLYPVLKKALSNKTIAVGHDGNEFGSYLSEAVRRLDKNYEKIHSADISDITSVKGRKCILYSIDCRRAEYKKEEKAAAMLSQLEAVIKKIRPVKDIRLVISAIIPLPEDMSGSVTALAEREYDIYAAGNEDLADSLCLDISRLAAKYVKEGSDIVVTRMCNVFGPALDMMDSFSFEQFSAEQIKKQFVEIKKEELEEEFSYVYAEDAVCAVLTAAVSGKCGNEYNISEDKISIGQIKEYFYKNFSSEYALKADIEKYTLKRSYGLSSYKLKYLKWIPYKNTSKKFYLTFLSFMDGEYDIRRQQTLYEGKLDIIRSLELQILKEIDRICRSENIDYMLAGGSLLGAVRHQGFIPWDDDIDVAFTRENYDKFFKACQTQLNEPFIYESPAGKNGCHYHFDKIRIAETYFSTLYSGHFEINDGVFVDILVYDQTSNSELFSGLQRRLVKMWTRVINIRWWGVARRTVYYKSSLIMLPLMKCIPFGFYHKIFDIMVKWYAGRKNALYVIDGLGQNISKGRFPRAWIEETVDMDFEGMKVPVPKEYDKYLRHWYGNNYNSLPIIKQRCTVHSLARIDLGAYSFGREPGEYDRKLSIKGELFEEIR